MILYMMYSKKTKFLSSFLLTIANFIWFYQRLAKYEPGKDYLQLSFEKIPPQENTLEFFHSLQNLQKIINFLWQSFIQTEGK